MLDVEPLFRPLKVKSLNLRNRIVMAPMGRMAASDGVLSDAYAPYYRRRAEGGVGLVVGEATRIGDPTAGQTSADSHFYGDDALDAWRHVASEVHDGGACFMPQLWHVGGIRGEGVPPEPQLPSKTPSGLAIPLAKAVEDRNAAVRIGEPLTHAEIDFIVNAYADGAEAAKAIGADGVEVHAAHGYLIDQFLWRELNQREDKFGQDVAGRTQFACEVVRAMRARVGSDFPIQFRFSQWKMQDYAGRNFESPQELEVFATKLFDAGVDIFHCSQRRFWEPEFLDSHLNLAGWTKKLTGATTITVGSVGLDADYFEDLAEQIKVKDEEGFEGIFEQAKQGPGRAAPHSIERLIEQLDAGEFDMVALARMLIANADWANLIREGQGGRLREYSRALLLTLE